MYSFLPTTEKRFSAASFSSSSMLPVSVAQTLAFRLILYIFLYLCPFFSSLLSQALTAALIVLSFSFPASFYLFLSSSLSRSFSRFCFQSLFCSSTPPLSICSSLVLLFHYMSSPVPVCSASHGLSSSVSLSTLHCTVYGHPVHYICNLHSRHTLDDAASLPLCESHYMACSRSCWDGETLSRSRNCGTPVAKQEAPAPEVSVKQAQLSTSPVS